MSTLFHKIVIDNGKTVSLLNNSIFITVVDLPSMANIGDISIGAFGRKTKKVTLEIGEQVLYEVNSQTYFEVRLLSRSSF